MEIKDLIADKKKIDEEMELNANHCDVEYYENKARGEEIEKGISVATKLIEDEIKVLETIEEHFAYLGTKLNYLIVSRGIKLDELPLNLEDRIKYLKSLLEQ